MKFLLDSNVVIALLKADRRILDRLRSQAPDDVAISSIVAYELFYGACKSARQAENIARVEALRFQVIELDQEDGRAAGAIRASLEAAGAPIGPYDLLIAGQALARDLTLVTRNIREFRRVEGLRVESWEDG
jgi:tRNA(fMet)-specific endonuclease VapC